MSIQPMKTDKKNNTAVIAYECNCLSLLKININIAIMHLIGGSLPRNYYQFFQNVS